MKSVPFDIRVSCLIIFNFRIPFLFSGYGSEEDAWGLILTARNIAMSGVYEVSRMPGHPVQEYFLSLVWMWPAWILNLMTAIVSTMGVGLFMLLLRRLKIESYLEAGYAFAFMPAFFINSSNVMDYTWTVTFTLLACYLAVRKKPVVSGSALALATGFRVTALGTALPAALLYLRELPKQKGIPSIFIFWIVATVLSALFFLPPYLTYGPGFFMYYQYFPDPPFLKNVYKATIGAWGLPGSIAMGILFLLAIKTLLQKKITYDKNLLWFSAIIAVMYAVAYYMLPQKAAFAIQPAPFVLMGLALLNTQSAMRNAAVAMFISSFAFGLNLDDPNRGSDKSPLAVQFAAADSKVAFDPLIGPVIADVSKRMNKLDYAAAVSEKALNMQGHVVLIAGWYQNEIEYYLLGKKREKLITVYYEDAAVLKHFKKDGYQIFYLPEQDVYNDLRYEGTFTSSLASPFPSTAD